MDMFIVIVGTPRTKKTSNRIFKVGKFHKVMPSEAFMTWQSIAVPQLRIAAAGRSPLRQPVNVRAMWYRDAERGDLVGYMQALADVLQTAGIVEDDKWIRGWDGSRLSKDAARPRVELHIELLTPV